MNLPEFVKKDFYPWNYPSDKLELLFKTHLNHGLTNEEALARIALFGNNVLFESVGVKWSAIFLQQFKRPRFFILIIAIVLSFSLGDILDSLAIFIVGFFSALISFGREVKINLELNNLKKLTKPKCRVIRNKTIDEVKTELVTLGDIILLEKGDIIPADARIISSYQLEVNEASLTGDPTSVPKMETLFPVEAEFVSRKNMLYSRTTVNRGSAKALVTGIGNITEMGKRGATKKVENSQTPLEIKIQAVSKKLLIGSFLTALFIAIVGMVKNHYWYDLILMVLSLAIVSIPEGLASLATLAEAIAIKRLARKNAIVRHLPAVERLGFTQVILTNKTGTLTTGKINVVENYTRDEELMEAAAYCNNATNSVGDPIEVALNQYLAQLNFKSQLNGVRIKEWPFDPSRKKMSVAITGTWVKDQVKVFTKGAPETLINQCNLSVDDKIKIEKMVETFSSEGKKVQMFTRKIVSLNDFKEQEPEHGLECLGLMVFADTIHPESLSAIQKCHEDNLNVVMITGDHPLYAKSIAMELGIIRDPEHEQVVTGAELATISKDELRKRLPKIKVFARVTSEDKLTILNLWQELNQVVAVIGNGVNDTPILKAASIGVSVEKSGTEVSKAASSLVLHDDKFSTLVLALEECRHLYATIKQTSFYLLSSNLTGLLLIFSTLMLSLPFPFFPIQLLWVSLMSSSLLALTLVFEPMPNMQLNELDRPKVGTFLTKAFLGETFFIALISTIMFVAIYLVTFKMYGLKLAQTYIFTLFLCNELFCSLASRSESKTFFSLGIKSNLWNFFMVIIPLLLQFTINRSTFLREIFRLVRITDLEFMALTLLALIPTLVLELKKKLVKN